MPKRFIFMGLFALIVALTSWAVAASWQKDQQVETEVPIEEITILENQEKIPLMATLFPWYDLAKQIGGERVEVKLLLPPGVEAHAFEPTPSDMIAVSKAKLFIYTGNYMEPWAQDILDSLNGNAPTAVVLGEGLATLTDQDELGAEAATATLDPHIWLDPMLMSKAAGRMAQTLAKLDPASADYYNRRLEAYRLSLEKLDNDYRYSLARCDQPVFIFAGHYAFGYLAERYNLKYAAAQGFSPDSEGSPQSIANLSNLLTENRATYLFAEELDNPQLAQAIAEENDVEILKLNSAHNLSRDDLKAGITYEEIMRDNLEKLKTGLKCQ